VKRELEGAVIPRGESYSEEDLIVVFLTFFGRIVVAASRDDLIRPTNTRSYSRS
jgi:hypothetical protein